MTRRILASLTAVVALGACSSEATTDRSATGSTTPSGSTVPTLTPTTQQPSIPTTSTTTDTTEPDPVHTSTSTTVVTTETSGLADASARSTIITDAGRIRAEYRNGQLDVDVDSDPGWAVDVRRHGPSEIDVVWTADGDSVRATVLATDNGISTTTRSVSSST